jgi:hypothetical protein
MTCPVCSPTNPPSYPIICKRCGVSYGRGGEIENHRPGSVNCQVRAACQPTCIHGVLIRYIVDCVVCKRSPFDVHPCGSLDLAQRMVETFHVKFGVVIGKSPKLRRVAHRGDLISEEAGELAAALRLGDMAEAIDGMCDLIYVILGTAVTCGIPLSRFFEEVHRTNMAKSGPLLPSGKVIKGESWTAPEIERLLKTYADSLGPPSTEED